MKKFLLPLLLNAAILTAAVDISTLPVDTVWSGHPVGFAVVTAAPWQYVAYYDRDRRMTVAQRKLGESAWKRQVLGSTLGWDSHNYVTLTVDKEGLLHVSGNMHVNPLVYFRTEKPHDIATFRSNAMTGEREQRVTYPLFFTLADGTLLFNYRDGRSGEGDTLWNRWLPKERKWVSHMATPLFDGEKEMSSYPGAPVAGPDGFYHMVWVWRDTSDASTCHDLSYAKTKDFVTWYDIQEKTLSLPLRPGTGGVKVDPIPVKGGIVNGAGKVGFDAKGGIMVSYFKYDEKGKSQVYVAIPSAGGWQSRKVTDWDYRWDFGGGGSIKFDIGCSPVTVENGKTLIAVTKPGTSLRLELESGTGAVKGTLPANADDEAVSKAIGSVRSKFPEMTVRRAWGIGENEKVRYALRWETLGPNRDRPREGALPEASPMELIRVETR